MRKPRVITAAVGFLSGGGFALWLNWAFSHPERKLANLVGLLVYFAVSTIVVGLAMATTDGDGDDLIWWIPGVLLTAIVLAFFR